jgi:hypothetical protein
MDRRPMREEEEEEEEEEETAICAEFFNQWVSPGKARGSPNAGPACTVAAAAAAAFG